jgi:hypothetical protein
MTEPDTSVDTAEESVTNQPNQEAQQFIENLVTETETQKKELSISVEHDPENPFHFRRQRDEGETLSSVANSLEAIRRWVDGVDDEGWELYKLTFKTTIVAQRTETKENGSENDPTSE